MPLVDALKTVQSDIVLTDYQMVNLQTGSCIPVKAGERGAVYKQLQHEFSDARKALPSIHSTTYRTALLRETGFFMQDNMFFVDEEYVILPYLNAESIIFYPYDVYRYQVADPNQSTSPGNRAKYQEHREKILRRLIAVYEQAVQDQANPDALEYCFQRIGRGAGDHFTTLYIYVEDRKAGREI